MGDVMTEHLPECPKSGCPACYDQGQRDVLATARCPVCEEPLELDDQCDACLRLSYERPAPKRTGRPPFSVINGECMRGHKMIWVKARWRCKPCEAVYAERKRAKRKASR